MKVVLADVEPAALAEAARAVGAAGVETLAVRTDVSKAADVEALAARTRRDLRRRARRLQQRRRRHLRSGVDAHAGRLGVGAGREPVGRHSRRPRVHADPAGAGRRGAHRQHRLDGRADLCARAWRSTTYRKHGVVALSETLHHELAMLGSPVKVSVLCPGFVNTRILDSARNRPAAARRHRAARAGAREREQRWCASSSPPVCRRRRSPSASSRPSETERFYVFPHPEGRERIRASDGGHRGGARSETADDRSIRARVGVGG